MWLAICSFLIGLVVTIGGAFVEKWTAIPDGWESVAEAGVVGVGTALMIAGILAYLVDRPLKQAIARDAFRSVMGWVSPERLQSELESVYRQPFFAIEHRMTVILTETPSGFTRMTLDIQRKIRNESLRSREFQPSFGLRNWGESGRETAITEISAHFKGKSYTDREKTPTDDLDLPAEALGERLAKPVTLAREDEVTVFYKGYEDKLPNDIHWEVFLTPTQNPTVTVVSSASVGVYVDFHSTTGERVLERESQTGNEVTRQWRLNGVMLPSQAIEIRWWPKNQYSVRQNSE